MARAVRAAAWAFVIGNGYSQHCTVARVPDMVKSLAAPAHLSAEQRAANTVSNRITPHHPQPSYSFCIWPTDCVRRPSGLLQPTGNRTGSWDVG